MTFPEFIPYVAVPLKGFHFSREEHKLIYEGVIKVNERGSKVNYLTVSDEVGTKVSEVLKGLTGQIVTAEDASEAANSIIAQWMLREASSLTKVTQAIKDTDDPMQILEEIQSKVFEITKERTGLFKPLSHAYDALIRSQEDQTQREPYWGLNVFENYAGGVGKGELVIISARPGAGKSSLFNNRLVTCVRENRPVVFWSGEMSEKATLQRFVCGYMNQSSESFDAKADYSVRALDQLKETVHYSFGPMTWEDLKPQIIHYHMVNGCKDFLIDRLELLYTKARMNEDDRIKRICGELRLLATKYDLRIDMAVQMRKSSEDSATPSLADVLGGTAITNDATKVLLINRPESRRLTNFPDGQPSLGKGELILAKNTFGPTVESHRLDYIRTRQLWKEEQISPF
jgi:replicative DNA helicase